VIKVPRLKTSIPQKNWLLNGVRKMTEKLTTYDPAEDLTSDEAMATFMAAAFETNDASRVSNCIVHSARMAIQR
jgi:DNA-binding phage protein